MVHRITFKRKQKQHSRFNSISSFFSNSASKLWGEEPAEEASPLRPYGETGGNENLGVSKDGFSLDWYVEGPGRRVGYDDLTAIDWIFEYTKERQRKRLLFTKGQGVLGHVRQLLDGSHLWFVLIGTGIGVGIIAAAIDVATNWLGDIKSGYCKSGKGGGMFYLNRSFCCWGYDGEPCVITEDRYNLLTVLFAFRPVSMFGLDPVEESSWSQFCWWRLCCGIYLLCFLLCEYASFHLHQGVY